VRGFTKAHDWIRVALPSPTHCLFNDPSPHVTIEAMDIGGSVNDPTIMHEIQVGPLESMTVSLEA
jgi:hypothetical protein